MTARWARVLAAALDELLVLGPFAPVYAFVFGARSRGMGDVVVLMGAAASTSACAALVVAIQATVRIRRGGSLGMRALGLGVEGGDVRRAMIAALAIHAIPALVLIGIMLLVDWPDDLQIPVLVAFPVLVVGPNLVGLVAPGTRTFADRLARVAIVHGARAGKNGPIAAGLATDIALLFALSAVGGLMTALGILGGGTLAWTIPTTLFVGVEVALLGARRATLGIAAWAPRRV